MDQTKLKLRRYIELYTETGSIHKSRRAVGLGIRTLEKVRAEDQNFKKREATAQAKYLETCETKVDKRAFDGIKEPILYEGEATGYHKIKYSDSLAMFRLKSLAPEKYRDSEKSQTFAPTVHIHLPDNQRMVEAPVITVEANSSLEEGE